MYQQSNNYVYYELDDHLETINDSKKQVDPSSNPKEDTHIIDWIRKLSVRTILFNPAVIGQDFITSVRETSRDGFSLKSFSPLNTISSKEIVTGAACNST